MLMFIGGSMLFNSIDFLVFYIVVISLYFLIPFKRFRWVLLLVSSYVFYMWWKPVYILLIIISTVIDYTAGIMMEKYKDDLKRKRILLLTSLVVNLGLLFVFKYFNYIGSLFSQIVNTTGEFSAINILLPMGISFYTFQTLSYTIDVYRGKIKAERHLGYFALYVSFFPQLVAGPIERSDRLIPQLKKNSTFEYNRFREGLVTMGFGFFKKMVIADRAAIFVNSVFGQVDQINDGWEILIAVVLFSFQIYGDFSGYSDIAIGSAKIMGIDLMVNFRQPYFAKSIREFWSRWHISLSTWFRDYLYIPLGGNRRGAHRTYLNIFIVFVISGIWHGANMTFFLWGMLHGCYHYIETLWERRNPKIMELLSINEESVTYRISRMVTTFILVNFAWIFFRANTIKEAILICKKIFILDISRIYVVGTGLSERLFSYGLNRLEMKLLLVAITALIAIDYGIDHYGGIAGVLERLQVEPLVSRWVVYMILIFSIIVFGVYGSGEIQEFIYFQF